MKTFAINGLGRIGRLAFRIWFEKHREQLDLKVINTSGSMELEDWAQLLRFDTSYGALAEPLIVKQEHQVKELKDQQIELGSLEIADRQIIVTAQRDPSLIPWKKYGVRTVLEATGAFNKAAKASLHLKAGAEKVLLSAPGKEDPDQLISTGVISVNDLDHSKQIFSNASCTTNCAAPIMKILQEQFGVSKALLTTVHSYTSDQNLHDNSHHKDLRRARAAAANIVPTSTGAAKATSQIIPALKDKFDGLAIRVPTLTVSLCDLTILLDKTTTLEAVKAAFITASQGDYQRIIAVNNQPLVSSDFIGCEYSAVVDLPLLQLIDGNLLKVVAWYDNEWGYSCRLMEQLLAI